MKQYLCKKVNDNIQIDGQLDKPEWKEAEAVNLYETVTGGLPKQATYAKLLWNDQFLYISFQCEDDYINATMNGYNDKLYNEEVVEVFIDDDRNLKTYIEIEVNPLNALLHYSIQNDLKGRFLGFARVEKVIQTAVMVKEGSWSVELAIPLTEFLSASNVPPKAQDKWRINLYRIDRPKNGEDEYSAWSPTGKVNFHLPETFGELVFVE